MTREVLTPGIKVNRPSETLPDRCAPSQKIAIVGIKSDHGNGLEGGAMMAPKGGALGISGAAKDGQPPRLDFRTE